ncbi:MAG: FAD-dependent oxidoreductase [Candidatus Saelkia tenebricola]|nr:FAD-dependent oxidoreductase [Candidatus Saelkia tenebricola]
MNKPLHITILGAGTAGLAVGYYAKKEGMSFTIYEARNRVGGLSTTFSHQDFLFDSGAHRFHNKDVYVTEMAKGLLGEELEKITIPSCIYHQGKLIDFPLSPLNLIKNIGFTMFGKALIEVLFSRLRKSSNNFEDFVLQRYGKTIAGLFLLNYSKKLWGISCDKLSLNVHGERLGGLNLNSFLRKNVSAQHLEGTFYYPRVGIGAICEKIAEFCGNKNILKEAKVSKILHNYKRIQEVEINGKKGVKIDKLVSTIPINMFLQILEPSPPEEILLLARKLYFRSVILVVLFLDKKIVTKHGTVYFPSLEFPFMRISEPKNRSKAMSPEEKTSLMVEIPSQVTDELWQMKDEELIEIACLKLIEIGWITRGEILSGTVERLEYAYPVLEIESEKNIQKIFDFLNNFSNLELSGRNGRFKYSWIHDQLKEGCKIIDDFKDGVRYLR